MDSDDYELIREAQGAPKKGRLRKIGDLKDEDPKKEEVDRVDHKRQRMEVDEEINDERY